MNEKWRANLKRMHEWRGEMKVSKTGKEWAEYAVGKSTLRYVQKGSHYCPNLLEVELDDFNITCESDKGKQLDASIDLLVKKMTVFTWLAQLSEGGLRVRGITKVGVIPHEQWMNRDKRLYGLIDIYKHHGHWVDEKEDNVQSYTGHEHGCLDWTNPWYDIKKCAICFMILPTEVLALMSIVHDMYEMINKEDEQMRWANEKLEQMALYVQLYKYIVKGRVFFTKPNLKLMSDVHDDINKLKESWLSEHERYNWLKGLWEVPYILTDLLGYESVVVVARQEHGWKKLWKAIRDAKKQDSEQFGVKFVEPVTVKKMDELDGRLIEEAEEYVDNLCGMLGAHQLTVFISFLVNVSELRFKYEKMGNIAKLVKKYERILEDYCCEMLDRTRKGVYDSGDVQQMIKDLKKKYGKKEKAKKIETRKRKNESENETEDDKKPKIEGKTLVQRLAEYTERSKGKQGEKMKIVDRYKTVWECEDAKWLARVDDGMAMNVVDLGRVQMFCQKDGYKEMPAVKGQVICDIDSEALEEEVWAINNTQHMEIAQKLYNKGDKNVVLVHEGKDNNNRRILRCMLD